MASGLLLYFALNAKLLKITNYLFSYTKFRDKNRVAKLIFPFFLFLSILPFKNFAQNGSSGNPFTTLGQAKNASAPGVYFFNLGGTTFSSYINGGWVLIASDSGSEAPTALPHTNGVSTAKRGILAPNILGSFGSTSILKISTSDGHVNDTSNNATLINRVINFSTLFLGQSDIGINASWAGTGLYANAVKGENSISRSTSFGTHLDSCIFWPNNDINAFHWMPYGGTHREDWSVTGEAPKTVAFDLWVKDNSFSITLLGTTGNCIANDSIIATVSGNTGAPYFELLQGGTVIRNYQASNIFTNLSAGVYTVQVQDANTLLTVQSSPITLKSSYVPLSIVVENGSVSCPSAIDGIISASVTGGSSPISFIIDSGTVTRPAQTSGSFSGLPIGSYRMKIGDACGVVISKLVSVTLATSTSTNKIAPRYLGNSTIANTTLASNIVWGAGEDNHCSEGAYVSIGGGWGYVGNGISNLSSFDKLHFFWRYIYPSGSNNLYGSGGIQNGALIPCSSNSTKMPSGAGFPFSSGDLVIYDQCGDSTILKGIIKSFLNDGNNVVSDYDCTEGGGIRTYIRPQSIICLPVTWIISDNATLKDTSVTQTSNNFAYYYGLIAGHSYTVSAVDAMGHAPINPTILKIPPIPPPPTNWGYYPDYNILSSGFPRLLLPKSYPLGTIYSYVVKASSVGSFNGLPALGFMGSHALDGGFFGGIPGLTLFGPNSDGSWPSGTYTIQLNVGDCYSTLYTFSVGGINASIKSDSISNVCDGFDFVVNANLDNPSLYAIEILPGSTSNIGAVEPFGNTVNPSTLNSQAFIGLEYGTYNFALICTSHSLGTGGSPLISWVVNYQPPPNHSILIDADSTGGYICSGSGTGSLFVNASSTSGSALQYSIDSGANFQTSNIFANVPVGTYPVLVKDACGDESRYYASVVPASSIIALASSTSLCAGDSVQFSIKAIGAESFNWSGPNGFSSNLQNPFLDHLTSLASGTYFVTVSAPSCNAVSSVAIHINSAPVLTITDPPTICAPATIDFKRLSISTTNSNQIDSTVFYADSAGTILLSNPTSISKSGTYYIQARNDSGCASPLVPVTVTINPQPSITLSNDTSICKASAVTLVAQTSGDTLSWLGNGSSNNIIVSPDTSTTYYAVATNSFGCHDTASVKVQVQDFILSLTANPSPVLSGNTVELTTSASVNYQVLAWEPFSYFNNQTATSQSFIAADSVSTYTVIAKSALGCLDTVTLNEVIEPNTKDFYIPNAFSPNGDGLNEIFKVFGESIKELHMMIFNQWGQLIYESSDPQAGWDGTYKGLQQPVGVYIYVVKAKLYSGVTYNKRGPLNLIR